MSVVVIWFSLAWGVWVECCSCSCGLIFWRQPCMLQPVGPTVALNATACGPNGQAQLLSNLRCRGQAGSPSALVPRHPAAPKPSCLPTAHSYLGTPQPPNHPAYPQPRAQHSLPPPLALACMASPGHAGDVRLGITWRAGLVDGRVTDLWAPGRPVELHVSPASTHRRAAAWVGQCGDRVRQFGDRVRQRVAVSGSSGFRIKGGWHPQPSLSQ